MIRSPRTTTPTLGQATVHRTVPVIAAIVGLAAIAAVATSTAHVAPIAAQATHTVRSLTFTPAGHFGGGFGAVATDGTRAFAVRGGAIEAYDVADPAAPRLLGVSEPIDGLALLSAADGRVAAVGASAGDLADPILTLLDAGLSGGPIPAGSIDLAPCHATGLQMARGFVAVACGADGVRMVDVRDPSRPAVARLESIGSSNAVAFDGQRLLVGSAEGDEGRLQLYDTTLPGIPVLIDATAWRGAVSAVGLAGHHAVVVDRPDHGNLRVAIARLEVPERWSVTAERRIYSEFGPRDLATSGTHAQIALSHGIRGDSMVLDIDTTRPDAPWVGDLNFLWTAGNVATLPSGVVISDVHRGLVAYGRDGDGGLVEGGNVAALSSAYGAAFDRDRLFVADDDAELWALDASNPASVAVFGRAALVQPGTWSASIPTYGGGLAVDGHLAYVTRGASFDIGGGVALVDVADSMDPKPLGSWPADPYNDPVKPPEDAYGFDTNGRDDPVAIPGGLLSTSSGGVTDLDVSDPSAPHFRRLLRDWYSCGRGPSGESWDCDSYGLAVDGTTAYVAQGVAGVRVYDLVRGAPTSAVQTFEGPEGARDVAIVGDALLVAYDASSTGTGLRVIDRRTGEAVRSFEGFSARRVDVFGDTAYVVAILPGAGGPVLIAYDVANPFAPVERGRLALDPHIDVRQRAPSVAVRGDLLAVVSDVAGVELFRLADGDALPAVDPGPTITPWPTWAPPDPRTPSPTSEVQPLPTRTSDAPPTVAPPGGDDHRLFVPLAVSR